MSDTCMRLTPELSKQIVSAIRSGGYPHVAAEAFGVPKDVFDQWMEQGSHADAEDLVRNFVNEVRQSFAQARLRAEVDEFTQNPKLWLIHGPGRESEQRPGWSVSVQPTAAAPDEPRNVLLDPDLMEVLRDLAKALEPYAEARDAVVRTIKSRGLNTAA